MVIKGLKIVGQHVLAFPLVLIAAMVVVIVLTLRQPESEEKHDVDAA